MAMRPKKTVLFVTGSRAEWGLMRSVVLRLRESPFVTLEVLVTGMHTQRRFGHTIDEVRQAVPIAHVVPVGERDDQTTALGKEIQGIGRYLRHHPADAILVLGDRDETFAGAVAGVHCGIPIIHVSGGDVSGPTVDHYLRNAMTVFSSVHLVQTATSRENVLKLGADRRWTSVVGSAGLDGLDPRALARRKDIAEELGLDPRRRWFLVVMHPTALDDAPIATQIRSVLAALRNLDPHDEKIILYPNADEGSTTFVRAIEKLRAKPHYHLRRHLDRMTYLSLLRESAALIGNSSSGLVEGGYLRTPFVHVGNRQRDRECGSNVLFVPYDAKAIVRAIGEACSPRFRRRMERHPSPYRGKDSAKRMVKMIEKFLHSL